jgi:hypothetical protein
MANVVEIVLRAIDKTKEGLTSPIRNLQELGTAIEKVSPAFLTLAGTAATAFGLMARHSIDTADEMGKLAQKAGQSVEKFSSLAYAAGLSDVSTEALTKGLKDLAGNIVEATKAGSEQESMFRQLGISIHDSNGNLRSTDAVLLDVATRFADSADGVGKTTAATKLFGKAGMDLIPLLNQGANGIRDLQNEASDLSQTFSGETSAASEEFNDNLKKLRAAAQGVVNQVVAAFIPSIAELSDEFVRWVKESGIVNAFAWTLIDAFKVVAYSIKLVFTACSALADIFVALGKVLADDAAVFVSFWEMIGTGAGNAVAIVEELFKGNFANAKAMAKNSLADIQSEFGKFSESLKLVGQDATNGFLKAFNKLSNAPGAPSIGQGPPEINVSKEASKTATKRPLMFELDDAQTNKFAENALRQLKKIADFRDQLVVESLRGTSAEVAAEDQKYKKQIEEIDQLGAAEDEFYALREQAFENHQQRLADIEAKHFEDRKRLQDEMTANIAGGTAAAKIEEDQRYTDRLKQIAQLNLSEEDSMALATKASQEYSEKRKAVFNQELQSVSGAFGGMAEAAKLFGKKGFEAAKAFAIAQAIIDTYTGAQAAFTSVARVPFIGPVLGVAAAAAAIAAGLARVATIRSTNAGVAHAGLGYVPEESTYILQKGERVLAPRQNDDLTEFLAHGGGGPTRVTLMIDGRVIGEVLGNLTRSGQLQIDSRAVVTT